MRPVVAHIAQIKIDESSGMGRVAWHWKREFERRGYEFVHIGSEEIGPLRHPCLFPYAAYQFYKKIKRPISIVLVHEPSAGIFASHVHPTIVFSHGVERREWQLALAGNTGTTKKIRLRTRILFPLWRLRQCDLGFRKAAKLLLINREDALFVQDYYRRDQSQIHIFRNGVYPSKMNEDVQPTQNITGLFLGSWLDRKGTRTLVEAARILDEKGLRVHWLLAGTGVDNSVVLNDWPESLRHLVEVIQRFSPVVEETLFARSSFFVLPSFFEGQPLALLQAMESGRCCITTNCCGQRDLIQHGYNGLLHQPGDADHLASQIEDCLRNAELRKTLGQNAKRTLQNRNWENVSSEVVDHVEKILFQLP